MSASNINDTEVTVADDGQSFSDLQNTITNNNSSQITLKGVYEYKGNDSFMDGVVISKNITIKGENCFINANNQGKCFNIASNTHVTLENIVFINGYSNSSNGGAVCTGKFVNLTLRNCVFKNNLVFNHNGGAVATGESCNVIVDNCVFENNTSVRQSSLAWGDFKQGMGCALYHTINSTLTLTDSVFKSNNAYLSTILLVSFDDVNYALSKLYIRNCIFENNTSFRCGVVYIDEFGEGEIFDSVFIKNHSQASTGTLILDTCPYALVKNCLFLDNTGVNGAGICVEVYKKSMTSNANIIDCRFTGNVALQNGGAISSIGGIVNIENCLFENNNAGERGGAVYSKRGSLQLTNCILNNNYADYGGGVYLNSNNSNIKHTSFLNNHASGKGTGAYLKEHVLFTDCMIDSVYNAFTLKGKIIVNNMKTFYNSGEILKISLNKPVLGVKLTIKIFTGKKFKTYYAITNEEGIVDFKIPRLSIGNYKVKISSDKSFKIPKTKKINIKVTRVKTIVKTIKKTGYLKVSVKNKNSKKPLSNIKVKIKIFTGKKSKTFTFKTDNKGIVKVNTGNLKKGSHKIRITSGDNNYKINHKSSVIC